MNFIIVFNLIINILILLCLLYYFILWRISFTWNKTFWTEKKYGFTMWWKPFNHDYEKGIISIDFINIKKIEELEEKERLQVRNDD